MKTQHMNFNSRSLLRTDANYAALILRITVAIVMWPHGAQQLLGWFGGYGYENTMKYFTTQVSLPWIIAFLAIMIQFFASLFLLAGLFTRIAAFSMLVVGTGMIFSGHTEHGFFMNWFGNQAGEGFEYHLLLLGLCFALISEGGGILSFDRLMSRTSEDRSEAVV